MCKMPFIVTGMAPFSMRKGLLLSSLRARIIEAFTDTAPKSDAATGAGAAVGAAVVPVSVSEVADNPM